TRRHQATRRRLIGCLALTAFVAMAAAAAVPAAAAATLQARVTAILAADGVAGPSTGLRIFDLSTNTALYDRHSATELLPASNEKLVTSATALARWGAAFRFRTELFTTGTLGSGGVYTGRIYLKGFGDPSLSTESYQAHVLHLRTSRLGDFVTALRNAGVKKIVGRVVGDDSYFDAVRSVASWKPGMTDYCGPLSALSLNEGIRPDGHWATNPPLCVAAQLTALLRKSGIPVSRPATVGVTPATALLSYTERSAPLSRILAAMNKPSDNFFAEMLTKGLGARFGGGGTTARGIAVERAFLISQGIPGNDFRLADGSGLSYADRLTTLDITTLLGAMSRRTDWPVFWSSLSVAGVDGTLAHRMRGTAAQKNLHGKTGSLTVASSLSGYVRSANGEWLDFSMLMNHRNWINAAAAHAAQDAIGVALARSKPPGKVVWTPSPAPSAN
ncbi:MAG: D-alanyl-D-alanine carboxypeptidase/D-alanyl-D-alanine-endopeptidase, partial [Thermoleophilia bacterium]